MQTHSIKCNSSSYKPGVFLYKSSSCTWHNWHCTVEFWLMLLPFISSNTTIYFFVKKFFSNVYTSVNTIFECCYLFVGWEISCVQWERGVSRLICTYALTCTYLFHFLMMSWRTLCLMVSCFICRNLTLPSFKKDVSVRNGYFSPMRSISVFVKFYFKFFFPIRVSQNTFNFNQIES